MYDASPIAPPTKRILPARELVLELKDYGSEVDHHYLV
jgi:hypothetical protein